MKIILTIGFILFISIVGLAENDTIIDSVREKPITDTRTITSNGDNENDITYPPRPPVTKISDIVKAGKNLKKEIHDLDTTVVNDVKREGLMTSLKKHRKFYIPIAIFVVLYLVWLKTRDKRR